MCIRYHWIVSGCCKQEGRFRANALAVEARSWEPPSSREDTPSGRASADPLLGVRDGAVFKVSLHAMESVKREVKDVKIIAACGSGRRFKISCPVECVRPSDDELARRCSSCDVFVPVSF